MRNGGLKCDCESRQLEEEEGAVGVREPWFLVLGSWIGFAATGNIVVLSSPQTLRFDSQNGLHKFGPSMYILGFG